MKCDFCGIEYKKTHTCKKRKQYEERISSPLLELSHKLYQMGMNRVTSIDDYVNSRYYTFFTDYSEYLVNNNIMNPIDYTKWLLKRRIRDKEWKSNKHYLQYIKEFINNEEPIDALKRSIEYLSSREITNNRLINWLEMGVISPWLVILRPDITKSFDEEHWDKLDTLMPSSVWMYKLKKHRDLINKMNEGD